MTYFLWVLRTLFYVYFLLLYPYSLPLFFSVKYSMYAKESFV